MRQRIIFRVVVALALLPATVQAHKPSDSYLTLTLADHSIDGRWDIALRDLEHAIGLDGNGDGTITWSELKGRHADVAGYALARLRVGPPDAPCPLRAVDHLVDRHSDGAYAVLMFRSECPRSSGRLDLAYRLFFDLDPQHRGLLQVRAGERTHTAIFSPERPVRTISLREPDILAQVIDYGREGMEHIWVGYDHVLFLITLLLSTVVTLRGGAWAPVEGFGSAFISAAKIVTAFTLAHSVTLSLAALDVVALPSRLVESMIAASVAVAALNNVWPLVTRRLWLMAFGFGLVHGFGFASVLDDLGLPGTALLAALAGFNLGVEAGQLAIVAVVLPAVYRLRGHGTYHKLAMPGGSVAIAGLGSAWLLERLFDLDLPLV